MEEWRWLSVCCWPRELQGGSASKSIGVGRELVPGVGLDMIPEVEVGVEGEGEGEESIGIVAVGVVAADGASVLVA